MSEFKVACVLAAAITFMPRASMAADTPATFQHEADLYAFEAKQYAAAGKPLTDAVAKRYARASASYRLKGARARRDR